MPVHPAIRRALRKIHALEAKSISAGELAAAAGLSKSRLLHLFKQTMGIPLRPYLQWLRCIDALIYMSEGSTVTEAALRSGFTDAAHCNRVMQQFFFVTPSALGASPQHRIRRCYAELDQEISGVGTG